MNTTKEQPTVLPWHREAAKDIFPNEASTAAAEDFKLLPVINACINEKQREVAAIIARHDPHAETLRLLEEAEKQLIYRLEPVCGGTRIHPDCVKSRIRTHLAAMKGSQ